MSASPTSSRPSWRSSPSQLSHYRGVQRGSYDSRLQHEKKPQVFETTFEVPQQPPTSAATEARKGPVYNYKPTALRWWFLAVLVAVLLALTAVTEHSLRSLPDYGVDYDYQRLARSLSERRFPVLSPRVQNDSVETTSQPPPDVKTVALPAAPPPGSAPEPSADPSPVLNTASVTSDQPTVATTTTSEQGETSKPPPVSTTPSIPNTSSIASVEPTPTPAPESQTSESHPPETPTSENQPPETPASETPASPTGGGGRPPLDKAETSARPPATSTYICFDCSPLFSTVTSAYLSLGTVTSTIGVQTTIDGKETTLKNIVTSTFTTKGRVEPAVNDVPSTTVVQQVTTLPDSTTVIQQATTDSAGSTVSRAVTSILPGPTSTLQSAVVLHAGESWITTVGPVATSTVGSRVSTRTTTFTNSAGQLVTSTYLITLPPTTTVVTATYGVVVGPGNRPAAPTGTSSSPPGATPDAVVIVIGISRSQYLVGSFLPTLLAVLLAMPLKAIDVNARLFQPFIALAKPAQTGATAEASVFLPFYGWRGALGALPRAIRLRQPVVIVGQLVVACAALLAPLAAEAVRVYVPDDCTGACPGALGADVVSGRALQALMAVLIALLVAMVALLAWVKTGVRQNPWSIAGMAALGLNREMRELLKGVDRGVDRPVADWEIARALDKRRYVLGSDGSESRYGVQAIDFPVVASEALLRRNKAKAEADARKTAVSGKIPATPFYLLTLQGRIVLFLAFSSVLILLLYYENSWGDTGFERFMNSQGFGVRFFFTAIGVALGFSMSIFFRCVAVVSPYLLMSRRPLPAQRSVLISPPTNPFSGLYSAVRQRHLYLGLLALASLLAEFLPLTLSRVPFTVLETYETQYTCTYLSIAILVIMMVAVASSLAVRWPHMPVDPRTIAGAMYYLCDSSILISFDGLAGVEMRDRDWMVKSMCVRYSFGAMVGLSGKERVGIGAVDVGEREGEN